MALERNGRFPTRPRHCTFALPMALKGQIEQFPPPGLGDRFPLG